MPMTSIARLRDLDTRVWSTATWAAPFIVQLMLTTMVMAMWLLGKVPPFVANNAHTGVRFLSAGTVTALLSVPVSGLLLRSPSPRVRGVALSIAGSSAIVFIGAIVFALWPD